MRKTSNVIQTRFIPFADSEVKVESKGDFKILRGYAAKFDSVSGDLFERTSGVREIIRRGFFRPALGNKTPIFALFNHDKNFILGERNAGTLMIDEDKIGLPFEASLSDSQLIRDMVLSPMSRGEITGCSFRAFVDPESVEYHRATETYNLLPGGCELITDVGPVTYPAYPDTEVAARSAFYERIKKPTPEKHGKNKDQLRFELYKLKKKRG